MCIFPRLTGQNVPTHTTWITHNGQQNKQNQTKDWKGTFICFVCERRHRIMLVARSMYTETSLSVHTWHGISVCACTCDVDLAMSYVLYDVYMHISRCMCVLLCVWAKRWNISLGITCKGELRTLNQAHIMERVYSTRRRHTSVHVTQLTYIKQIF